mmetsp:Transcript_26540/g.44346  ORF Transcript_26540/g.44346 Transcript_26540/m.44346 type:complete len:227 (-) Transcript_26540:1139-1819(-)
MNKKGVNISRRFFADSSVSCVKGEGVVLAPTDKVFNLIWDMSQWKSFDPNLEDAQVLETYSDNARLVYTLYKGHFPVSPRDMLTVQYMKQLGSGSYVVFCKSVNSERMPEEPGIIRADVLRTGFIIEPSAKDGGYSSSVTFISHVDLRGWIPSIFCHLVSRWQALIVNKVAMAILEKSLIPSSVGLSGLLASDAPRRGIIAQGGRRLETDAEGYIILDKEKNKDQS